MKFKDSKHERFYRDKIQDKKLDCYNRALIYLLALIEETRNHFKSIYDIDNQEIEFNALNAGWQTGTSVRITRLAFNLFNGFCYSIDNDKLEISNSFTVSNIFDTSPDLNDYFFEAIKIRYPTGGEVCD